MTLLASTRTVEGPNGPTTAHLTQDQLALRWHISTRTLETWRWRGEGPAYLKLRGRILYRLEDVEAFEAAQLHAPNAVRDNLNSAHGKAGARHG